MNFIHNIFNLCDTDVVICTKMYDIVQLKRILNIKRVGIERTNCIGDDSIYISRLYIKLRPLLLLIFLNSGNWYIQVETVA